MSDRYWLERAWLGDRLEDGVLVTVEDGRFSSVEPGVATPAEAVRLAGLTLPGLANCHSHAFHRALRGRTQVRGTFWSWRERMYDLAGRLTPDTLFELARATYREMAAAGITTVGEFHYLHHDRDGRRHAEANATGLALVDAAREAGIRIALLDTCYLASGIGAPPEGVQRRFSDGTAEIWAERAESLASAVARRPDASAVVVGAAIHSVRAVPREALPTVASWATGREAPLHVHVSEQVGENEATRAAYGCTPTELLADAGALGPLTTAVHATHLTDRDVALLGSSATTVCACPTTERDLGDGVGPFRRLRDAGAPLSVGSDSHAVVDPFEELRAVELDERLVSQERGHWAAEELAAAATYDGHRSLGFADAGRIEVGARADLVTLDTASPRTAGTGATLGTVVFAASAADVTHVVVDGRVVSTGDSAEVGRELDRIVTRLWEDR
ncbi:formimidoylglutamate deiminase [Nocardioides caldifontis]|uniref:formimidoylglutamate deiminase n=1 Tax=Nocardioides caldifontis TaxID=2588938 RepID=UPI0011DFC855|nr:formimidoylglutamate deiminase [Nocardioides caldifontis]